MELSSQGDVPSLPCSLTEAAHFTFWTSFEQQQNTKANHDQNNKEEEADGFAYQHHQEVEIYILQEVEWGELQEATAEGQKHQRAEREIDGCSPGRKNPGPQATQITITTVDAFDCDVEIDDRIKARRIDDEQPCFENSPQEEEEEKARGRRG